MLRNSTKFAYIRRCLHHRQYTSKQDRRVSAILGFYEQENGDVQWTTSAQKFISEHVPGDQLNQFVSRFGLNKKQKNKTWLFPCLSSSSYFDALSFVNLGKKDDAGKSVEMRDEVAENIRVAIAGGLKQLQGIGATDVVIDPCSDAQAAAEAAKLTLFSYDELKTAEKRNQRIEVNGLFDYSADKEKVKSSWEQGAIMADSQNTVRKLMEMPANILTPTRFGQLATECLQSCENVDIKIRDKKWAESMKMGAYLSVAHGADEPLAFVEIAYNAHLDSQPVVLVGKGITFDSGGISIKPSANMDLMRGDMGGAACVLGALTCAARLKLPIKLVALMPLCENMPSGRATRPGDVVYAMNGKSIQVDNTDAEGRLILCDALCYADTFKPSGIIDIATLTGAIGVALGSGAAGAFTNSSYYWSLLEKASYRTGDRVWRMPLFQHYTKQMTDSQLADLNNISNAGSGGGSCTAAAFLKEFVTTDNWVHLDIAGVMSNKAELPYLGKGMSGRPLRTVVEFLRLLSEKQQ